MNNKLGAMCWEDGVKPKPDLIIFTEETGSNESDGFYLLLNNQNCKLGLNAERCAGNKLIFSADLLKEGRLTIDELNKHLDSLVHEKYYVYTKGMVKTCTRLY